MANPGILEDFSGGHVLSGQTSYFGVDTNVLMAHSQRMNLEMLPQDSQEADMVLPFMWLYDWADLSMDKVFPASILNDFWNMGVVDMKSFTPLKTVGTASTGVATITVFAWMEDIELEGPSYYPQADEYEQRPVSVAASAVADVAGVLAATGHPTISPAATLVSSAARMASVVARSMGYTAPHVVADDEIVRTRVMPNTANTTVGSAFETLAIDPKNGLTSSSRVIGADGTDELELSTYCSKKSFWFMAPWASVAPVGVKLASWFVSPECYEATRKTFETSGSYDVFQMTPSCHAAQMFTHWRGTMEYTIKVSRTKYHQGKLRITYDPVGYPAGVSVGPLDSALQRNFIMDLGEDDELIFTVPYMAPSAYLTTGVLGTTSMQPTGEHSVIHCPNYSGTTEVPYPYSRHRFNGIVHVTVLNALTSPVETTSLDLAIYSRLLDAEMAVPKGPDDNAQDWVFSYHDPYYAQSTEVEVTDMGKVKSAHDTLTYFGERVLSLRALLGRTVQHESRIVTTPGVTNMPNVFEHNMLMPRIPRQPGVATEFGDGYATNVKGASNVGFVSVKFNPITYLYPCFVGQRGSIRWRHFADLHQTYAVLPITQTLTRDNTSTQWGQTPWSDHEFFTSYTNNGASDSAYYELRNAGFQMSGLAMAKSPTEPVLHTDVPMYQQSKIFPCNPQVTRTPGLCNVYSGIEYDNVRYRMVTPARNTNVGMYIMKSFVSAGADYSPLSFVNVPTMFRSGRLVPGNTGLTCSTTTGPPV
jgi:hypothetical protein